MKNITKKFSRARALQLLAPVALMSMMSACENDEIVSVPELQWLPSDSTTITAIAKVYDTMSADYPSPWNPANRSTWGDNLRLDTVIDPATGEACLAVGALTLYQPEQDYKAWAVVADLKHVKEFRFFANPDVSFDVRMIPVGTKTLIVQKINASDEGYIDTGDWNIAPTMNRNEWSFQTCIINGTNAKNINCVLDFDGTVDLSGNQLEQRVNHLLCLFDNQVNLSHNNLTTIDCGFEGLQKYESIPDFSYNNIKIPAWLTETEWWTRHHRCFIGNPGYVAPK